MNMEESRANSVRKITESVEALEQLGLKTAIATSLTILVKDSMLIGFIGSRVGPINPNHLASNTCGIWARFARELDISSEVCQQAWDVAVKHMKEAVGEEIASMQESGSLKVSPLDALALILEEKLGGLEEVQSPTDPKQWN